jgi:hypothetical protein
VDEDDDVVNSITEFVRSFSSPLLANLEFDYGDAVADVHPRDVPAHFDGSEVLVAGRYPLGLGEIPMRLRALGATGDQDINASFKVVEGKDFVPRFWAYKRIKDLEDRIKYDGAKNATIEEIIQIGIEFHFATDYTSLFVELPDEVQERFDGEVDPVVPSDDGMADPAPTLQTLRGGSSGNSSGSVYGSQTNPNTGSTSSSTADSSSQSSTSGTIGLGQSGQPQGATRDTDGDSLNDPSPPQNTYEVKGSSASKSSLDNDGLPDIEENYDPYVVVDRGSSDDGASDGTLGALPKEEDQDRPAFTGEAIIAMVALVAAWVAAIMNASRYRRKD